MYLKSKNTEMNVEDQGSVWKYSTKIEKYFEGFVFNQSEKLPLKPIAVQIIAANLPLP